MRDVHVLGVGATSFLRAGHAARDGLAREAVTAALADAGVASAEVGTYTLAAATSARRGEVRHGAARPRGAAPIPADLPLGRGGPPPGLARGRERRPRRGGLHRSRARRTRAGARRGAIEALARRGRALHGACRRASERAPRPGGLEEPRPRRRQPARPAQTSPIDMAARCSPASWWRGRSASAMVAPPSKAAAAVVLAASDRGRRGGARAPRAARLRAAAPGRRGNARGGRAGPRGSPTRRPGVGPEDIDCAEVDHPTAAGELAAYEVLRLRPGRPRARRSWTAASPRSAAWCR